jgi:hypothetical protein
MTCGDACESKRERSEKDLNGEIWMPGERTLAIIFFLYSVDFNNFHFNSFFWNLIHGREENKRPGKERT